MLGNTIIQSRSKLAIRAGRLYLLSLFVVGALLFSTAGSFGFWNAWLFIGALFIPMLFVLVYLLLKEPDLLEKRMKTREKEKPQKAYVVMSVAAFIGIFAVPGFDYRHRWSDVPDWLVVISTVMMEVGYGMFFVVMRQNRYASRVVEIQEGQKLIDTGLYSIVRHPMYTSASVLYIFSALVLGSYYALIPMILIPFLLSIRIVNEEKVLKAGLPGYADYMKRVRYRLIPFVW